MVNNMRTFLINTHVELTRSPKFRLGSVFYINLEQRMKAGKAHVAASRAMRQVEKTLGHKIVNHWSIKVVPVPNTTIKVD